MRKEPFQLSLFSPRHTVVVDPALANVQFIEPLLTHIDTCPSVVRYAAVSVDTAFKRMPSTMAACADDLLYDVVGHTCSWSFKRMQAFARNTACVRCGIVGNVFLIEHHANDLANKTLNLYSCSGSQVVLMTVDHILPDSWFGRYDSNNFQTMCLHCNQTKQHVMTVEEIDLVRSDIPLYAKAWVNVQFLDMLLHALRTYHTSQDAAQKAALWILVERWRRRIKHTTSPADVDKLITKLATDLSTALSSAPTNVVHDNAFVAYINKIYQLVTRAIRTVMAQLR